MTKTTIEFPTQLLALAKVDAAKGGLSLRQWMTAVVASALEAEQRAGPRDWVTLTDLAAEQNPFVAQVLAVLETVMPRTVAARLLGGIAKAHGRTIVSLYPTAWTEPLLGSLHLSLCHYSGPATADHLVGSVRALLRRPR